MDWPRFPHLSLSEDSFRRAVTLVWMAVILYLATGIFYKILTIQLIRMRPLPAAEIAKPTVALRGEPIDAYRVIPERNLFGTAKKKPGADQAGAVPQLQDIALLIDLRGTVASGARYGFAIVEEKRTRKQRLVKVGDLVAGAKVARIRRKAMDLLVNDRVSTLTVLETKRGANPVPSPAVAMPAVSPGTTVVSRGMVQEAMANMGKILTQAQVRPYFSGGVPDGFIIGSIRPGSFYQKMGIANGDIIREVNNRKIRTVDDVMGLLNSIRSGASLSLGITRQGKAEILNYQFQ